MSSKALIRFLIASNCVLILLFGLMAFGTTRNPQETFTEINVQRLNIVGENGKPVMVLANKKLIPGPSMNGKDYSREIADGRQLLSGIIFFNDQGDEVGGLLYNGIKKDSSYSALGHLSFDQWKQNQVVALQYLDNGKSRRAGLRVWDRPTNVSFDQQLDRLTALRGNTNSVKKDSIFKELKQAQLRGENGIERLFIGSQDEIAQIQLRDNKGKVRLRMYVDKSGEPRIEFLNADGEITNHFVEVSEKNEKH